MSGGSSAPPSQQATVRREQNRPSFPPSSAQQEYEAYDRLQNLYQNRQHTIHAARRAANIAAGAARFYGQYGDVVRNIAGLFGW